MENLIIYLIGFGQQQIIKALEIGGPVCQPDRDAVTGRGFGQFESSAGHCGFLVPVGVESDHQLLNLVALLKPLQGG